PPRPLAYRSQERAREGLANGDDLRHGFRRSESAVAPLASDNPIHGITGDSGAEARAFDSNTNLVVLRQIADQKWIAVVRSGKTVQRVAGEGGPDTRRRQNAANTLTDKQVLRVQFGKIVNVGVPRDVSKHGQLQGEHGQLGHVVFLRDEIII